MAVAYIDNVITGRPTTSEKQTQKKRELVLNPYLEVVGRTRIMEISPEPTLSREQQAVSLPLYCIS